MTNKVSCKPKKYFIKILNEKKNAWKREEMAGICSVFPHQMREPDFFR